jgi:hypothetical protein
MASKIAPIKTSLATFGEWTMMVASQVLEWGRV